MPRLSSLLCRFAGARGVAIVVDTLGLVTVCPAHKQYAMVTDKTTITNTSNQKVEEWELHSNHWFRAILKSLG